MPNEPKFYTYPGAAARVGRDIATIKRWRREGMPMRFDNANPPRRVVSEEDLLRTYREHMKNWCVAQAARRRASPMTPDPENLTYDEAAAYVGRDLTTINIWRRDGMPMQPNAVGLLTVRKADLIDAYSKNVLNYTVAKGALARMLCIICGDERTLHERPWCSKTCRLILREEARARFSDLDDTAALAAAVEWARRKRSSQRGFYAGGPLTSRISARLAEIPKRKTGEATAARRSKVTERFEVAHPKP